MNNTPCGGPAAVAGLGAMFLLWAVGVPWARMGASPPGRCPSARLSSPSSWSPPLSCLVPLVSSSVVKVVGVPEQTCVRAHTQTRVRAHALRLAPAQTHAGGRVQARCAEVWRTPATCVRAGVAWGARSSVRGACGPPYVFLALVRGLNLDHQHCINLQHLRICMHVLSCI